MARRVFFSFHHDRDVWRANQVRNSNVVAGADVAGFFDHSEYEEAKKTGDAGISRMILKHLKDTTVTVVLIGTETANRPWVKFEIAESVKRMNGLLGVRIHHLKVPPDQEWLYGRPSLFPGPTPAMPFGRGFPVYAWDKDLAKFRTEIEAAGKRADDMRARAALAAMARRTS
jgi:hypothetical protein